MHAVTALSPISSSELLAVVGSRLLCDKHRVFAGIGLPTLAVALAQATTNPGISLVYESGVCGAHPPRLPETISDTPLATGAEAIVSQAAVFGCVLQGGHIDVGFLGAAQIDRHGSLNSTVIGSYDAPKVRLPGSGGAIEVLANSTEVFVVMRRHSPKTLVDHLDFCTSASPRRARERDPLVRVHGRGVTALITELGVMRADQDGELCLTHVHQGIKVQDVVAATGWPLRVAPRIEVTAGPTERELRLLREEIDPKRVYLR